MKEPTSQQKTKSEILKEILGIVKLEKKEPNDDYNDVAFGWNQACDEINQRIKEILNEKAH